jgi:hypothetical protein
MLPDEVWDDQAAQDYDTPGEGMFAPAVILPAVDFLAELAGDGAALEFAIGTGRIAVPLAARGVPVSGIDSSPAMIARLRSKAAIPGRRRGHDDRFRAGAVRAGLCRLQRDPQPVDAGGAGRLLPERGPPPGAGRPSELDLMGQLAGFRRESRHADWSGAPFTAESTGHIAVYRLM